MEVLLCMWVTRVKSSSATPVPCHKKVLNTELSEHMTREHMTRDKYALDQGKSAKKLQLDSFDITD